MHNVIYSWCLLRRIITVCSSKKQVSNYQIPRDGAVSITFSFPFLFIALVILVSFVCQALIKYLRTFRALMRLIPVENHLKKMTERFVWDRIFSRLVHGKKISVHLHIPKKTRKTHKTLCWCCCFSIGSSVDFVYIAKNQKK